MRASGGYPYRSDVCQQTLPLQAISAEAVMAEPTNAQAPNAAPSVALPSSLINQLHRSDLRHMQTFLTMKMFRIPIINFFYEIVRKAAGDFAL
jgi:hypothetical protein